MAWPTGTVTFLFSDIEGSTRLLQRLGDRYGPILEDHRMVMRAAIADAEGQEVLTEGDSFFVVFATAHAAVRCALSAQQGLAARDWPADAPVRVRIGIHTGMAHLEGNDYWGLTVHEAARISSAAHGGQVIASAETVAAAGAPAGASWRDLGVHRLKDLDRPMRLHQLCHAALTSEFAQPRTLSAIPHNLPEQLTTFVGREGEMADLQRLLEQDRLVTVVGPGGCGKTRLTLQVGAAMLGRFDDGVWVAELAQVAGEGDVARTVGMALGVADDALRDPVPTLVERLRHTRLLLVLDNCEHVIAAAADLAMRLATSCPQVHVLATSREPLGVEGERVWQIAPLDLPPEDEPATTDLLVKHESTRLFLDRARLARPDLDPAQIDPEAVVRVCRRLDGIPLAIELAASRVRVMGLAQLDARLDDRFRLLTGGSRTAMPRQQTLRATVDWSYELLDHSSKVLLARLAVLSGSFPLEAAEAVGARGAVDEFDVLDLLGGLVHRSLLLLDDSSGAPRYRMLETIRQYALERLGEGADLLDTQRSLRRWVLALAREGEPEHMGAKGPRWHDRFEQEWPHIRAAFESALDDPDGAADAASLIADLGLWYWLRAHHGEGRRWADAVVGRLDEVDSLLRARVLLALGVLAVAQLDLPTATPALEESLRLGEELGEHLHCGWSQCLLGVAIGLSGDIDTGMEHLQKSLALAEVYANPSMQAGLHYFVGTIGALGGDRETARVYLEKATQLARTNGATYVLSRCLPVIGVGLLNEGRADEALALFTEALEVSREVHDRVNTARALAFLGDAALARGDIVAARAYLEEALPIVTREVDGSNLTPRIHLLLGAVDRLQGQVGSARAHLERAQRAIAELGSRSRELADAERLRAELALLDGDRVTARAALQASIEVARHTNYRERTARALRLLARIDLADGRPEVAEAMLAEAAAEVGDEATPELTARLVGARGEVELARGNAADAVSLLHEAASHLVHSDHPVAGADAAIRLAAALGQLGRFQEALSLAAAASVTLDLAGAANSGDGLTDPAVIQAELRAGAGNRPIAGGMTVWRSVSPALSPAFRSAD